MDDKAFFIFGFAKNERDNIGSKELKTLKDMAKGLFDYNDEQLDIAVDKGIIVEVKRDG